MDLAEFGDLFSSKGAGAFHSNRSSSNHAHNRHHPGSSFHYNNQHSHSSTSSNNSSKDSSSKLGSNGNASSSLFYTSDQILNDLSEIWELGYDGNSHDSN